MTLACSSNCPDNESFRGGGFAGFCPLHLRIHELEATVTRQREAIRHSLPLSNRHWHECGSCSQMRECYHAQCMYSALADCDPGAGCHSPNRHMIVQLTSEIESWKKTAGEHEIKMAEAWAKYREIKAEYRELLAECGREFR